MVERIKTATQHNVPFWVCLTVSIALIVVGFFTPPMAVIDGSVFIATGEMFAYAALYTLWLAIKKGTNARLRRGNTSLSVGDATEDDNQPLKPYHRDETYDEEQN